MAEVACIVVSYRTRNFTLGLYVPNFHQNLRNVTHPPSEPFRFLMINGVVLEQFRIFLECRSTTSSIDNDVVDARFFKHIDVVTCHFSSLIAITSVDLQSTATNLLAWYPNFQAVTIRNSCSCHVDVREKHIHHAACEECRGPF